MNTTITTEQAADMFSVPEVYLYVCDGKRPDCPKTFCHYNGMGDCRHTEDESHALYPVHDFSAFMRHPAFSDDGRAATICVEPVRA